MKKKKYISVSSLFFNQRLEVKPHNYLIHLLLQQWIFFIGFQTHDLPFRDHVLLPLD